MKCPIEGVEIATEVCPITRCSFRTTNGDCIHDKVQAILSDKEYLSIEDVADLYGVRREEARVKANESVQRIQIALVFDRYLDQTVGVDRKAEFTYGNQTTVVNKIDRREAFIARIFGVSIADLKNVLKRERYEAWQRRSSVDVTFDQIFSFVKGV